ncbi:MAG: hypothetical protein HOO19_11025 [Rhodospirillaceae bacterium]|jgi:hypothetical protein|nr:hypothetical protein [Rhodospirillaceae bacterium]MBT4116657.1 hypothetical protein [Rhodospirillaceae bacterium]MBT4673334.1 hypothetical protein [Rhodospirillaceae bacterium]MBT4720662.1 hypothetical protein [Rhodospirillaceae bacterium]MBT4749855.1 hypothetical protein [Rhodospirillaceae bacterium]
MVLKSAALLVAMFAFAPAHAAPQILGLVAAAQPIPLTCEGGVCRAEVSAVCLQQHRKSPEPGTAYLPAQGTEIALTGAGKSVSVAGLVKMTSVRGFTSVSVSLAQATVRALGLRPGQVHLSVGAMASALPVAVSGDANPLSEPEIARYIGPLRPAAEGAIRGDVTLSASDILNQMINRLPHSAPVGASAIAPARAASSAARSAVTRRLLSRALDECRYQLRTERTPGLRSCLGNQHDILISGTTQKVWKSLRPGG